MLHKTKSKLKNKALSSKHQASNELQILNEKNSKQVTTELMRIQNSLIVVGAVVADSEEVEIEESEVEWLEKHIDYYQSVFGEDWYKRFLLPGGVELAARIDVARSVCRRVERTFVKFKDQRPKTKMTNQNANMTERIDLVGVFLNRLSDYLFALRCFVNHESGYDEREFK